MTQYLLSVWHDAPYDVDEPGPDLERIGAQVGAFNAQLEAMGAMVTGGGLEPPERAIVARVDGADVVVSDGPRAAPLPAMGGFWIIDVADRDTALRLAREATRACEVPVELRAFHEPI
jgi:hypothetical protein